MVKLENHLGVIDVSYDYLEGIVKNAVASCYGIAGLKTARKKRDDPDTITRGELLRLCSSLSLSDAERAQLLKR